MNLKSLSSGALATAALFSTQVQADESDHGDHSHPATTGEVYELDDYIVSAGPGVRSISDYAAPVTVVTADELQRQSGGTLGAILDWQPGVSTSSFATGASRPILRGFDGPRVSILESGLNSLDVSDTSPDHGVSTEPLLTERIEVLRGPTTLLYGSSAIGGAVNVIGKEIPRQPVDEKGYEGGVEARYDTVSEGETYLGYATVGQEQWALTVTGLDRDADDYEVPDDALHHDDDDEHGGSTLENSFFESNQYSVGGSWFFTPENRIGVSYSRYESEYGIAGHDHDHGGGGGGGHDEEEDVSIDLERDRYDFEMELVDPAEWITALRTRFAYTDYEHTESAPGEEGTKFERDGWEFRTEAAHTPWWIIDEGVIGVQFSDVDFKAVGEEIKGINGSPAFGPPSTTETQAIFVTQHIHADQLHYEFGGRIERADVSASGDFKDYDEVAFSLAGSVIWNIDETNSLALVLQRAERHPTATELFANGPHNATGTYEIGDDGLDQEVAYGVDLTYRTRLMGWTTEASVFYTYFEDYIFGQENESIVLPPEFDELHVLEYTSVEAEFYGFEFATQTEILRTADMAVTLGFMADYIRAKNEDSGDDLPRIPPMRVGSRLGVERGAWTGGLELRYAFEQEDTAPEESETDGYTELNADASYRFEFDNDLALVLFARAENLLDEEIRNHTSFTKDEVPLPGRNLTLGGRFEF